MHWVGRLSIGVANKRHYLSRLWIVSLDLKHTGASFSPNSIDSLCLWIAVVPRSRIVVMLVLTTTQPNTVPLAHTSAASFSPRILPILTSSANISRMQAHQDFLSGIVVCHNILYMCLKYGLLTGSESSDSYPERYYCLNLAYFCKFLLELTALARE
jgi:hypothetical protein